MEDKMTINYKKQIIAWLALLIIVWAFGGMFLNAVRKPSEEKPSDKLKPKTEEQQAQTQNDKNNQKKESYIGKLQILTDGLNFRSEPRISNANIIKTLKKDEVLPIISSTDDWYEVMSGDQKGYVTNSARYVKVLKTDN